MPFQEAIHPRDAVRPERVLSSRCLQAGGLVVEHQVQPPGECEIPRGLTHHLLVIELGHVPRQVFRMGGRDYDAPLLPGDILLIPAQTPFLGACETSDQVLAVTIDPMFLQQVAQETNCPHADPIELLSAFKGRDRQLRSIVQAMQNEMRQVRWGDGLYLDALASLFAVDLLRTYASHPLQLAQSEAGLGPLRLNRVLDYIHAHLDQNMQLADLAKTANLSQCYFASLFKQSMGMAPWQYVVQQRVERAKRLLRQGDHSLAEVAFQCGFSSQSHFTQQFRRWTGVTPKTYRDR